MKQSPILFNTAMVQAILAGTKTQTRRIIKSKHESGMFTVFTAKYEPNVPSYYHNRCVRSIDWDERTVDGGEILCPYGQVGDVLWVREEHYRFGYWEKNGLTKTGRQKWKFKAIADDVRYFDNSPIKDIHPIRKSRDKEKPGAATWYKRLARFMPRSACRLYLQITDIRVQRLQDISEADAKAEGAKGILCQYAGPDSHGQGYTSYVEGFKQLWQSINGSESWEANPWVWVISFKQINKPE
jgi:hypothetical protein